MSVHLQRSTLVHSVAEQLRQMILAGDVQPGEYLPSRKDLAARFGVGISTIHEAIQALTALGLVASHPGKGTWVREDALETIVHRSEFESRFGELDAHLVCEARSVIEVALTELAAQRAASEDVERIWEAIAAMEAATQSTVDFVEADLDFHLAVAQAGKNSLLEQFYHISRKLLSRVVTELVREQAAREESIRIQRVIAKAIEQRDPLQARQAALDHMDYIGRLLEAA
ncbi:MAG: FadR/GntR family transcriptional regulator [Anaerolineae bacterium]|jgi:GntR family transcriptional repressor for pyruvate dehydrogenase complex